MFAILVALQCAGIAAGKDLQEMQKSPCDRDRAARASVMGLRRSSVWLLEKGCRSCSENLPKKRSRHSQRTASKGTNPWTSR